MEENMRKRVSKICIEAKDKMETTAEAWVFVGTDRTNKIDTSWVYIEEEKEEGIAKMIYMISALALIGQKLVDAIIQSGAMTGDKLQEYVEMAMQMIKAKEKEAEKC